MPRPRINKAVASSSTKVERTSAEIRREMRALKNEILYNNRIDNEMYERRMSIMDGSADLSTNEPERKYEMCFGEKVYI